MDRVVYDLTLTDKDIDLVEKYEHDNIPVALWLDPFYIMILRKYLSLIPGTEYNTQQVFSQKCIKEVLSDETEIRQDIIKQILITNNPVKVIQDAANHVCDAVPMAREKDGVNVN